MGIGDIKYKLEKMGYSLHEIDSEIDVERLIIDILEDFKKTGNSRTLKAIPFIIYQSFPEEGGRRKDKPYIDLEKLGKLSREKDVSIALNAILYYTKEIFKKLGLPGKWTNEIEKFLERSSTDNERNEWVRQWNIKEDEFKEEIKYEFLMQRRINELKRKGYLVDKIKTSESRNMLIYLSRLFTKKQREIIQKIIDEKPLDKTEYEYYIRVIKKRLEAIAELQKLAGTVIRKRPEKI